ncbi:hypothetical protein R1W18_002300 [Vibrio alginolyticus]|nr:hypothetical protein [Vibrio alginolyticus]
MTKNEVLLNRYELAQRVMQEPKEYSQVVVRSKFVENKYLLPGWRVESALQKLEKAIRNQFKSDVRRVLAVAERLKAGIF